MVIARAQFLSKLNQKHRSGSARARVLAPRRGVPGITRCLRATYDHSRYKLYSARYVLRGRAARPAIDERRLPAQGLFIDAEGLTSIQQCINQIVAARLQHCSIWPPRHRRAAGSTAWRCGLSPSRFNQNGRGIVEKGLVKNYVRTGIQLVQIFAVYAYLLYVGCNMISDGAELLMLTPYSKLVGCCILPILGAVPDGAIVLFSGLGPDAQENLDVGVGALAGSTVMLLTIPWGLAIFGGRVNLDDQGKPVYDVPRGTPRYSKEPSGVFGRAPKVRKMALWMAATALPYVVVEAGALLAESKGVDDEAKVSLMESNWALAALVLCLVGFVAYLYTQYQAAFGGAQDDILEAQTAKGTRAAVTGYGVGIVAALEPHLHLHTVADADSYQGLRDDEAMPTDAQLKLLRGVLGPYFSEDRCRESSRHRAAAVPGTTSRRWRFVG